MRDPVGAGGALDHAIRAMPGGTDGGTVGPEGSLSMMPTTYEFRVEGRLTDQAREAFCDMDIEEVSVGTALVGNVIDEAHLLGIMAQCRTLGLIVISAHRIPGSRTPSGHP
jgi:hypothetical protein